MRHISAVAIVAVMATAGAEGQTGRRDELVARASAYVVDLLARFTSVVAEERYVQETTSPHRRRELRSDFLLVKPPGSDEWFQFRDVVSVDGKEVSDREQRLTALFLNEPKSALARAQEVTAEGSRFNLESIGTLNKPLFALAYLQPRYASRFRFTVGPIDKSVGDGVRLIQFTEWARPTILRRSAANGDLPARGRIWVEEATGRVLKTALRAAEAEIVTTFEFDDTLQLSVPLEMRELYRYRSYDVTGVATYGRFRRFEVRTEETIR